VIVKMIIDALKEARRSIARSMKDHKEQRNNARLWKEKKRSDQQRRESNLNRPNSTASLNVFEPVQFLVFCQMTEVHGGKLKRERLIYLAANKIESIRGYGGDFDEDHIVLTCGGVEYIVFGSSGDLFDVLEYGVDTRPDADCYNWPE